VSNLLSRWGLLAVLALLTIGFSIGLPDSFATTDNLRALLANQIATVFVGLAVTLPLIVGQFDLSIGYVLGFAQVLVASLVIKWGGSVPISLLATFAAAVIIGTVNGLLVVKVKMNALIATLATGSMLLGIGAWYTGGSVVFGDAPKAFTGIARNSILGIPLPVWYAAVVLAALVLVLSYLPTGRRMYAIGGNVAAARLAGINVNKIVVGTFVVSSVLASCAGIILSTRLGSGDPALGPDYLLPGFAAGFLGATTMQPGRFNVVGTVVAVYVLAVPVAGLQIIGVPSWFQDVFNGAALILAAGLAIQSSTMRERRARRERLAAFTSERKAETPPVSAAAATSQPTTGA
jgi:ribose transport system permease protein